MASAGREFFTVKTVSAALREFAPARRTAAESVPLNDAYRRVCAADVIAAEPLPGFARSSVDGYAVRARDTFGAGETIPAYLRVVGTVRMGAPAHVAVGVGTAVEIPTGGMLPSGADAVVMIEHTQEAMLGTIEIVRPAAPGDGVIRPDEDAAQGQPLIRRGRRLRAEDVAILAAAGIRTVEVHARPQVAVLATGDEIVPPSTAVVTPGQVRDALSLSLAALIREAGGDPATAAIVPDDRDALRVALADAVAHSDLVIVAAGSSVGTRDQTAAAVTALEHAQIWCHGIAIKPGKPTLLAQAGDVPVIGLPGNPRSALVVFRLIGMPLLRRISGEVVTPSVASIRATLSRELPSAAGRLDVVQVSLRDGRAEPLFGPSALLSVLTAADGYLIVPEDANGLPAGAPVDVIPYG